MRCLTARPTDMAPVGNRTTIDSVPRSRAATAESSRISAPNSLPAVDAAEGTWATIDYDAVAEQAASAVLLRLGETQLQLDRPTTVVRVLGEDETPGREVLITPERDGACGDPLH